MHTVSVRELDGSLVVTLPEEIASKLRLSAGAEVRVEAGTDRLVFSPVRRSKYTLRELLADCDASQPLSDEERQWMEVAPIGRELPEG